MAFTRDELMSYEKGAAPAATENKVDTKVTTDDSNTADGDASDTATQDDAGDTTTSDDTSDTSTDEGSTDQTESGDDGASDDNADSSTADADSQGDEQDDDAAVEPPRGSRARERIEELVAERNSLRKYGEHLLARIEEIAKAKGVDTSTQKVDTSNVATGKDDPAPTLEQFKFDQEKFAKAQNDWIDIQVEKRVEAAVQGIESKREGQAIIAKFEEKATELRKVHKDFDVVVANPNLPQVAKGTAAQILRSDLGPRITYHLAKNPDIATRIARQSPEQQLVSVGGLIAKFQAEDDVKANAAAKPVPKPQVKKKTVTNAPPPGKRVQGGGTVQKGIDQMSMDEFVAYDRAEKLKQKQARQQLRSSLAR